MTEHDWEAAARTRLENLVTDIVARIRSTADEIERDARRNIANAAEQNRGLDFQTYPRAAGQVVHEMQTLIFNLKVESLIDAAAEAERARTEKAVQTRTLSTTESREVIGDALVATRKHDGPIYSRANAFWDDLAKRGLTIVQGEEQS